MRTSDRSGSARGCKRLVVAAWLATVFCVGARAQAQNASAQTYNLQLFRPAVDSKGYITVNASQVLGHLDWSLGLVGTWAHNVMNLTGPDKTTFNVSNLITPQLQFTLGLFKYIELGASLPFHILSGDRGPSYSSPDDNHYSSGLTFGAQYVGDIGFHLKGRLLNSAHYPIGIGLLFSLYAPSGDGKRFLGEGQTTFRPELILDREWGHSRRFKTGINFGAIIRPHQRTFTDNGVTLSGDPAVNNGGQFCEPSTLTPVVPIGAGGQTYTAPSSNCGTGQSRSVGTQLTYSLGMSYAVVRDRFDLVGELYGMADVTGAKADSPLEGLLAIKVYLAKNSYFQLGGGAGLLPHTITDEGGMTGSPQWRLFLGFIFEPHIGDKDGDGIPDDQDRCPDEAGERSDFDDENGCPVKDTDNDGVPDRDDKCPTVPGPKSNHGCPVTEESDRDGDGIPDSVDKCPDQPEDKDGFEDEDGCPDPDNDKDGILDKDDLCPNDPEDKDGFEDEDGCPDPDNDHDRILDKDDKCPNEPETYNGFEDEDGCPDKGRVVLRRGKLEILDKIYFETGKAIIKPVSFPILNAVVATLKGNPQILLLEIQGHADERGNDDYNMRLTEDRAAAVRQYLIDHGLEADRLQSHGYGETKPVDKGHNEKAWSQNRRVEFVILKRSDGPAGQ